MTILDKHLIVTMRGERWSIPVRVIAEHRAKEYAHEFDGDVMRSMKEDTAPLFAEDEYEIKAWATNNMNWSDVRPYAKQLPTEKPAIDYQAAWVTGKKEIGDLS